MINIGTIIKVADNSGAILVCCINVLRISSRIGAVPGQMITIVVKKNVIKKHVVKKSKIIVKRQICKALVVRTTKGMKRWGNSHLKSNNAVVLLNIYKLPYATRLFGLIFREVKLNVSYLRVMSLAQYTFQK